MSKTKISDWYRIPIKPIKQNKKGFTIIELLVVIAIIGLLSSVVLVSMKGSTGKARIAKSLEFSQTLMNTIGVDAVGIWSFDEGSGPTAFDKSGYGNHGTLVGPPAWVDGEENTPHWFVNEGQGRSALSFDGTNNYINCGSSSSLNITDAVTIEAWVKSTKNNASLFQGIVGKANLSGAELGWILSKRTDNKFYFQVSLFSHARNDVTTYSDIAHTNNAWRHLTGVLLANGSHHLYVNGVRQTASYSGTSWRPAAQNISMVIGTVYGDHPLHAGYNERFGGLIDEVRIYERALSSAEIQQHYADSLPRHQLVISD